MKKLKKKLTKSSEPDQETHPGQHDHGGQASVSGPSTNANVGNMAGSTRGSARSR
jgi:hypothetical protein